MSGVPMPRRIHCMVLMTCIGYRHDMMLVLHYVFAVE